MLKASGMSTCSNIWRSGGFLRVFGVLKGSSANLEVFSERTGAVVCWSKSMLTSVGFSHTLSLAGGGKKIDYTTTTDLEIQITNALVI